MALFAAGSDSADATCRRVVQVQKRVVVQKVKVAQFIAVPVAVPAYAVGYADNGHGEEIKLLREEIKLLREMLSKGGGPVKVPEKGREPPHLKVFRDRCASCHGVAVAKAKGGGLVLVGEDGSLAPLSTRQALKVVTQVVTGAMPKGGKLTDDEMGAIIEWAEELK